MQDKILQCIQKSHPDALAYHLNKKDGSLVVTMQHLASTRDIWLGSDQYKLQCASAGLSQEHRGNLFVRYLITGEA
jgi:hypothetical protein